MIYRVSDQQLTEGPLLLQADVVTTLSVLTATRLSGDYIRAIYGVGKAPSMHVKISKVA